MAAAVTPKGSGSRIDGATREGRAQIGSILPYLDRAVAAGYSFIVLNPNENYVKGKVGGTRLLCFAPFGCSQEGRHAPNSTTACSAYSPKRFADGPRRLRLANLCGVRRSDARVTGGGAPWLRGAPPFVFLFPLGIVV